MPGVRARRGRRAALAPALLIALLARPAAARELWRDGGRSLELRTTFKVTGTVSRAPDDTLLYPERLTDESLWRLRLEPIWRPGPAVTVDAAYEQRVSVTPTSGGLSGAVGVLPREFPAPYRLVQLDAPIREQPGLAWRQELDRAYAAFHTGPAEITAGRQAVGWGRGTLFGAVDLFVPFTPLEADREWRRGIDALRADVKLGARASADFVGAFSPYIDSSCTAVRLRGYSGALDGELVLGQRARDLVAGLTSSAAIGSAELHGELAYFRTPEPITGGGRDVTKLVLGGSYRLGLGAGVPLIVEYHYSGFGIPNAVDIPTYVADPAFRIRYGRGDTQILGQHALALLASADLSPALAAALTAIADPHYGSGVLAPNLTLRPGDRLVILAGLYVPWGAGASGTTLHSFYGSTPLTALLQVTIAD